jgi:release factor glutamine methyltransferase
MNADDPFLSCVERMAAGMQTLPDKPDETADATVRALWHLAAGKPMSLQASIDLPLPSLHAEGVGRLATLIEQRLAGVPLAHLTGIQRFMELDLLSGKEALIPRRETELLGYAALDWLRKIAENRHEVSVVDVCTGSGNLAVAMAHYEPKARVFASDLSTDAVVLAKKNAAYLRLGDRVEVREGDLLAPFDEAKFHGTVDLLLCNPPYISSRKVDTMPAEISGYEPRLAFDGGPYGINLVLRLIREASRYLATGGLLAFEIGLGQGPAILQRLSKAGFTDVQPMTDDSGEIRAVRAIV